MSVFATPKPWTLAELHALPDDGNRYELVHGLLFVTPAPSFRHEIIASLLSDALTPYVLRNKLGRVFRPRAVIRVDDSEAEPDVSVRAEGPRDADWVSAPRPLLVAEVVSPATRVRDRREKRALYREAGIPEYWIVDPATDTITVVREGRPDQNVEETLVWLPDGVSEQFELDVVALFA